MGAFTVYPAIDLRGGRVVRLVQGDPNRQTIYEDNPAAAARRWLEAGALWLHVVNLDGAFGEADSANRAALEAILVEAGRHAAAVQFGGGLRRRVDVERVLALGVRRVLLGTLAAENPAQAGILLAKFGPEAVGAALDASDGLIRLRGWKDTSGLSASGLGKTLYGLGLRSVIYTDIARDGTGSGANIAACQVLQAETGLAVIASGGVHGLEDIRAARQAGLAGVIAGRALYQGNFSLQEALQC